MESEDGQVTAGRFEFLESLHHVAAADNASYNASGEFLLGDEDSPAGGGGNVTHVVSRFTHMPEGYAVPALFAAIFLVGVVGNGTLIYTVARNKTMRNTPNIFIVSLAAGDLLLILVSVPFTSTYYTLTEWPYGGAVCKCNEFLQSVSLGVSVFTLTALSGDRYTAIVDPMRKHTGNPLLRTTLIAACIWAVSVLLALPDVLSAHVAAHRYDSHVIEVCSLYQEEWGDWYPRFRVMARFIIYFAAPILIIGIFYALMARILIRTTKHMVGESSKTSGQGHKQMEARKKVAKVVLSFVVIFFVCWFPRHIYLLWFYYDPSQYNMFWHVFKITGFCLSFINSCINPLTLYFLSKQFRHYYKKYLFCCCTKKTARYSGLGGTMGYNMADSTHGRGTHTTNGQYSNIRGNSTSMTGLTTNIITCDSKV